MQDKNSDTLKYIQLINLIGMLFAGLNLFLYRNNQNLSIVFMSMIFFAILNSINILKIKNNKDNKGE